MFRRWLSANVDEIKSDPALTYFIPFLIFNHLLTYLFWRWGHPAHQILSNATPAVCWPIFLNCGILHHFSPQTVSGLLLIYPITALFFLVSLLAKRLRTVEFGLLGVLVTELLKLAILLLDYRLRQNHHLIEFWVVVPFLFLPYKRQIISGLLIFCYVAAGCLKLNPEWLSGGIIAYGHPRFARAFFPWGGGYVILMELVLVWGLIAKHRFIFWFTVFQLSVFHILSYPVVGFYYPLFVASLDAFFVLNHLWATPSRSLKPVPLLVFALFWLVQIWPRLYGGDFRFHREGTSLSLNMFDAANVCRGRLRFRDGGTSEFHPAHMISRNACDPIVFYNLARETCGRENLKDKNWDADLELETTSLTGRTQRVIDYKNFCTNLPGYRFFAANHWIRH